MRTGVSEVTRSTTSHQLVSQSLCHFNMPLVYLKEYASAKDVADSWKSFWTTVGVVSALIATIAYSGLLAYPDAPKSPYSSSGVNLENIFEILM